MKTYVIIAILLVCSIWGWVNEVGMEEKVICGEVRRIAGECDPCVRIRGCDGEYYLLFVPLAPKCKFVKIVNPVWGTAHMNCSEEVEGEIVTRKRSAHCITSYSSIQCISSCEECTDPCAHISCYSECFGCDLWEMRCVDGECVKDYRIAMNSEECGCATVVCEPVCVGNDLWSQKAENGRCVLDELVEANSVACGYDPCVNHCDNGKKDCREYGVDCGGGCPVKDSDHDNVEDCMDKCPYSRCNKVDVNGCETDVDNDGVTDCDDACPLEEGDPSNEGCPTNALLFVVGIGAAAAAGGIGLAFKGVGTKVAEETGKQIGTKVAEETGKQIGTKVAEETGKQIGTKVAEETGKQIGTKVATATGAGITGVTAKIQKVIHCPQCGEKMSSDSEFCSKCGRKL